MMTYVALLRGINVGGNNKVEMARLKKVFESLGFINVRTYINSGNVIFDTDTTDIVHAVESAIKKIFSFDVKVVVRDAKNIQKLCDHIPDEWKNDAEQKTDVLFLWDKFDSKSTIDLIVTNPKVDTLKYVSGAIIWNIKRAHYTKSGLHKFIGTEVYKHMTARNVNTVRMLNELLT